MESAHYCEQFGEERRTFVLLKADALARLVASDVLKYYNVEFRFKKPENQSGRPIPISLHDGGMLNPNFNADRPVPACLSGIGHDIFPLHVN